MFLIAFRIICAIAGLLSSLLLTYYLFKVRGKRGKLPWVIWHFWVFAYFPFVYLLNITSIILAISQIIQPNFGVALKFYIPLFTAMSVGEQQVRVAVIITMVERLISTIFLEGYAKLGQSKLLVVLLCLLTYIVTIFYTYLIMFFLNQYVPIIQDFVTTATVLLIHLISATACKYLQIRNFKMYRLLAFRCSLKRRYLILQNVKSLSIIWHSMVILSFVAPLGPFARLLYFFIFQIQAPTDLHFFFYNVAFILVQFKYIRMINRIQSSQNTMTETVAGPMGNPLPTNLNADTYFDSLKDQWK